MSSRWCAGEWINGQVQGLDASQIQVPRKSKLSRVEVVRGPGPGNEGDEGSAEDMRIHKHRQVGEIQRLVLSITWTMAPRSDDPSFEIG